MTVIAIIIAVIAVSSLLFPFKKSNTDQINQKQSLLNFFERTGGKYWVNSTGWFSESGEKLGDHCNWFGITCGNIYGQVVRIDLPNNNLTAGDFELSTLGPINSLMYISLHGNRLKGDISRIMKSVHEELQQLSILILTDNPGLKGKVSQETCSKNSNLGNLGNFTLRVGCNIKCKCCGHEIQCNAMN